MLIRTLRAACVFTLLLAASLARAQDPSSRIGVYHWSGERTHSMSEGVERIAAMGARVARVAITPRYYTDYGVAFGCFPNYSLSTLADEPDVRRAFDEPGIDVLILTAYDGTSFGDCRTHDYLRPEFYTPEHTNEMEAEYGDFVLLLFERYNGSNRRFIISNWEADNAIYCGGAFGYGHDPLFRQYCDANYSVLYAGNASPKDSFEGMRRWFTVRASGIAKGVARAHALGLSGVDVIHAPEISAVHMLESKGFPGVLGEVLAVVRPTYVSYSAYESTSGEDPGATLTKDIQHIRDVSGAANVLIGEVGYARSGWKDAVVPRMSATIEAAMNSGAAYFILWNLYDQDAHNDFGLFDRSGAITPAGALVKQWVSPANPPHSR